MATPTGSRRSLFAHLAGVVAATVIIVLGLYAAHVYDTQRSHLIADLQHESKLTLARLTRDIAPYMEAYSVNEYEQLVTTEVELSGQHAIVVNDFLMGKVIGEPAFTTGKIRLRDGTLADFDPADAGQRADLTDTFFSASAPIHSTAGVPIGHLTVYRTDDAIRQDLRRLLQASLLTTAVAALVLTALLLWLVHRLVIRPLSEVTGVIEQRDADGIPTQAIPALAYREVAGLTDTMNTMLAVIRRSRDSLQLERTRLANIVKGTYAGTWEWHIDSGTIDINERWTEMLGETRDSFGPISFDAWSARVHPDDLAALRTQVEAHLAGTLAEFRQDFRMRHRDGHWVWILGLGRVAQRSPGGQPLLMSGVHIDISAQKQQESEIIAQRAKLNDILEGTHVGTWVWNVRTGAIEFNERWAEIVGHTLADLAPVTIETWTALAHPDDLKRSGELLERHFAGVLSQYECEARMRHKAGHWVWVLDRGKVSSWTEDGKPLLMSGTRQDITERKTAEQALAISEAKYRLLYELLPVGVSLTDADGQLLESNPTAVAILGVDPAVAGDRSIDHPAWRIVRPDGSPMPADEFASVRALREQRTIRDVVMGVERPDDEPRWIDVAAAPLRQPGYGVVIVYTDITARLRGEQALRQSASVFEHAHEGIMLTDLAGTIVDVNEAFERITGYTRAEVLGQTPRLLSSGKHDANYYADLWRALLERGQWQGEMWNRHKNGHLYALLQTISVIENDAGKPWRYLAMFTDITSYKEQQHKLEHIAHYDPLTDLPNRSLLADRLHQAMAQARRAGVPLAVAYLDLDGFKEVNDRHGHDVGDQLLTQIAGRMLESLRDGDTLARLGGDEFVAVLMNTPTRESCTTILDRLLAAVAQPVYLRDRELRVSVSIGFSFYPQAQPLDADQLIRQADQAMYAAKQAGRNRYCQFDLGTDSAVRSRFEQQGRIAEALDKGEFELHYQPKVDMKSGRVLGVEGLIRWRDPERGLLTPDSFLPMVANHALGARIGEWVIDTAATQIEAWRQAGQPLPISVNVDGWHLGQPDFVERLTACLARHPGVEPGDLALEVLESSALEDMARISRVIEDCGRIGVDFALDDFGVGYSTLIFLKRLPAKVLKIDRGFVHDMLDDPGDLAILEGVLGLANAFSRETIAEGVERVEQGLLLLSLGCRQAQGYAIARPMPAAEIPAWAATWRPDPAWTRRTQVVPEALPTLFAIVEFRAWMAKLKRWIDGRTTEQPILDRHHCAFGKWLAERGFERYLSQPEIQDIVALHDRIHEAAHQLAEQGRHRDPATLQGQVAAIEQLGETMTGLLDQLAVRDT
ncbi:MAG: EAL domain-containing protein [Pseudomonadota bacterium]